MGVLGAMEVEVVEVKEKPMRRVYVVLCIMLAVVALTLTACGGSSQPTIKGTVTKVDLPTKTFTVQATDGKSYDFKMVADSKGDLSEIKEHMDLKKQIEVKYRGTTSPYEVVSAD